jgi:hypothetical protein
MMWPLHCFYHFYIFLYFFFSAFTIIKLPYGNMSWEIIQKKYQSQKIKKAETIWSRNIFWKCKFSIVWIIFCMKIDSILIILYPINIISWLFLSKLSVQNVSIGHMFILWSYSIQFLRNESQKIQEVENSRQSW